VPAAIVAVIGRDVQFPWDFAVAVSSASRGRGSNALSASGARFASRAQTWCVPIAQARRQPAYGPRTVMSALHDDTNGAGVADVTVAITGADGMRVELVSNANGNSNWTTGRERTSFLIQPRCLEAVLSARC